MHPSHPESTHPSQRQRRPLTRAVSGTYFLLSISRDEDDSAAIRADLKRSRLGDYKLQQCSYLEDAVELTKVCGFDLAIVRLDDYQRPQAAIDRLKSVDPSLPILGFASARLLSQPSFATPTGIDELGRLEDLSPSLIESMTRCIIDRQRNQRELQRLEEELALALDVGEQGSWRFDLEHDKIELDAIAATLLGYPSEHLVLPFENAFANVHPEAQDAVFRAFRSGIEESGVVQISFELDSHEVPTPTLALSGRARPRQGHDPAYLFGVIRRTSDSKKLQQQIESAQQALQSALSARDDALAKANAALQAIATGKEPPPEERPKKCPIKPPTSHKKEPPDSGHLTFNTQTAFQSLFKSISEQKIGKAEPSYPFDFSQSDSQDYSYPDPSLEGFINAAHRLASMTENGHGLKVSLDLKTADSIEQEAERGLIFDALKELLTNVIKHAHAKLCSISLFREQGDWVLQVEDDGVGLRSNLASIPAGFERPGLFHLRSQLTLKGGLLELTPASPRGLVARARLPANLRKARA